MPKKKCIIHLYLQGSLSGWGWLDIAGVSQAEQWGTWHANDTCMSDETGFATGICVVHLL